MDKLYIGIDSILDFEFAMIRKRKSTKQQLKYLKRVERTDVKHPSVGMGYFTQAQYDKMWDNRDKELLSLAVRTKMDRYVRDLLDSTAVPLFMDPHDAKIEINVDLFPFELEKDELEWLMSALIAMFGFDANIKFIDVGIGGVNSAFIEGYKWVIIKDVETWITMAAGSLQKKNQLETNVIAPAYTTGVKFSELVEDPDVVHQVLAANSPHELVCSILGQIVNITMIDPRYFKVFSE